MCLNGPLGYVTVSEWLFLRNSPEAGGRKLSEESTGGFT